MLDGGTGSDRLFGGAGADIFIFADGTGTDFIFDFEDGVDLIQLDGLSFDDVTIRSYRDTGTQILIGDDRIIMRDVAMSFIS